MDHLLFKTLHPFFSGLLIWAAFVLRYLVIAGGAFLVFYVVRSGKFSRLKIQQKFPEKKKLWMEIGYSMSTFVIFALNGVLLAWLHHRGLTLMYTDLHAYSIAWLVISVFVMLVIHDTYFYWTHRMMHTKLLFPLFHKVHHLSNNPSPWASFSFHPLEAVVEAGILPVIAFVLPVHPIAILFFLLIMTVMNVLGHLGYELFPKGFTKHAFWKWSNTSTHHNMHHRLTKCNYGLYFNFWDRVMGTNHEGYDAHFEEVKSRKGN